MPLNVGPSDETTGLILEIQRLSKSYPGFRLNDVNLAAQPDTIIGLLGRNGAGKSTLIKCALGLVRADSGIIKFHGKTISYGSASWRQMVGYVAESHPLYDWMRVERFLSFIAAYYPSWDTVYHNELLRRFRVDPLKRIRDLSHGMRVKVALISALAYRPSLLVLDEPISGLDPAARAEFLAELREEISRDPGTRAVIMSSHVLEDITAIADEVIFIKDGELISSASIHDLYGEWKVISLRIPSGTSPRLTMDSCRLIGERNGATLLLCSSATSEAVKEKLMALGAEVIDVRTPTLQELFLALA